MVRKTTAPEAEVVEGQSAEKPAEFAEGTAETLETESVSDEAALDAAEASEVEMPDQTVVDAIIRKRVYAALGVGFVPLPLVDLAALTAVQLEMIYALSKVYGVEFKKERVKSIISSLCGGAATVASVPMLSSLFKSIPIVGLPLGAASISITGGAVTYAIGLVFERHFRQGGTLCDFDVQGAKDTFKAKIEEGKEFVSKMRPKKKSDDIEADFVEVSDIAPQSEEPTPA